MKSQQSPPSMNNFSVPVLEPPETLFERAFNFPFYTVNLIASDSLLSLQLRIIETPALRNRPICRLALFEPNIVVADLGLGLRLCWVDGGCIGGAITSEILHVTDTGR